MTATFYVGDAIQVMNTLPEKSVDLILTSPPFLALRSYLPQDHPDKALEGGSQATPGAYIDWLLDVVESCARVLAPHGSLCFELGDTYSGSGGAGGDYAADGLREGQPKWRGYSGNVHREVDATKEHNTGPLPVNHGTGWPLAKSLSLIPESFRFAMVYGINPHTGRQTEPWRLRNVIRWVRPNPPVGALGDKFRPATSELMVFCKAKDRFFDLDAVRTPTETMGEEYRPGRKPIDDKNPSHGWGDAPQRMENPAGAPPLDWWNIPLLDGDEETRYGPKPRDRSGDNRGDGAKSQSRRALGDEAGRFGLRRGGEPVTEMIYNPLGSPPLDWWNIPPGGYPGAHYAVWPPELLVKPIKAMCPEKVCRRCGEPQRRQTETSYTLRGENFVAPKRWDSERLSQNAIGVRKGDIKTHVETLGFSDCGHDDYRPGLVLDPFAGSGTTLAVATGHGRDAIGIDLDERNYELSLDRVGPLILQRGTARRINS